MYYNSTQFSHCQSGENIRSHSLRAQSYEIAPPFGGQLQVIGYPQLLFDLTRRGFRDLLPLGFNDVPEQLTELRETRPFTSLLKDMIKDTDEQPDEVIYRKTSGKVLSAGVSVFLESGYVPLVRMCSTNLEALNAPLWEFYRGFFMQP